MEHENDALVKAIGIGVGVMLPGGGSTDEKILKVKEQLLADMNRIEHKTGRGGIGPARS